MGDRINDLLARCYAAIAKDGCKFPEDQFQIDQGNAVPPFVWWVGYRNSGGWKNNSEGATLRAALENWMAEYEHHYDGGPYR